jgi:hypothetical protein
MFNFKVKPGLQVTLRAAVIFLCMLKLDKLCALLVFIYSVNRKELRTELIRTSRATETVDGVVGLCVLDNVVYVVRSWSSAVEVYSTMLSGVERQIPVPGLDLPFDMTGCVQHKCLYLTDYNSDVHRIEVGSGGSHRKWPAGPGRMTLSVTRSTGNVVVTLQTEQKVFT